MEKPGLKVEEPELVSAFKEANEVISNSRHIAKELFGDKESLSPEMREDAINRLYEDDYEFKGLTEAKLREKVDEVRRFDAAITLRHMVFDIEELSSHYPKHMLYYHIGILRAYLFCTDEKNSPFDLPKKVMRKLPPGPEVEKLAKAAMPEIEKIFSAIKRIGFSYDIVDAEAKWKDAALDCFGDSKKGWTYVKKQHLEDSSLYGFSGGKEKRDFEACLLRRIVKDQGLGNHGGQSLRDIARKKS